MTAWTSDERSRIGAAEALRIASRRRDGTLCNPVTVRVVRHGDDFYVRSVNGPSAAWFRGAQDRHDSHSRASIVRNDVAFVDADHNIDDDLDAVYRTKGLRCAASIIDAIVSPEARSATLKPVPRCRPRPDRTQKERSCGSARSEPGPWRSRPSASVA